MKIRYIILEACGFFGSNAWAIQIHTYNLVYRFVLLMVVLAQSFIHLCAFCVFINV